MEARPARRGQSPSKVQPGLGLVVLGAFPSHQCRTGSVSIGLTRSWRQLAKWPRQQAPPSPELVPT
eukprot:3309401-Rhodomonas_salina.1